ncbi:hypothetical protein BJQ94_17705 [Cryobacterium sp. SO2]|uniref:hypothetical protein n=1 Tax=Cryobacterium sp. SO2 TaxID=1897060 RepID=UPI00223CD65A|nr:hypothetical protein [Cryobacterium sp. SO2]WEO77165.1 hypothetical protein BJQ94_17705 [Cryobacterium sp. SO2]
MIVEVVPSTLNSGSTTAVVVPSQRVILDGDLSQDVAERLIAEQNGDRFYNALEQLTVSDSGVSAIALAGASSQDADELCEALYSAAKSVSDEFDEVDVSSDVAMMSRRSDEAGDSACALPHP